MKKILCGVILTSLFAVIYGFTNSAADFDLSGFSGNWILNLSKSDAKVRNTNEVPLAFMINIKGDSLAMDRTFANAPVFSDRLKFAGEEKVFKLADTMMAYRTVAELPGKNALKVLTTFVVNLGQPSAYKTERIEIFSLSADGKTLALNKSTVLKDTTIVINALYEKR